MSWKVTPLASIDIASYDVLPFGEHGQALPFVRSFVESGADMSDMLSLDASAVASLKRAICTFANVTPDIRPVRDKNGKPKTLKSGKPATLKVFKSEHVRQACESLSIALRVLANTSDNEREYVALVRTDTDES